MSSLVGTGNILWSGAYVVASALGFIFIFGLLEAFYIRPYGITIWWYQGLLFVMNMIASVVIFGGLVIFIWNHWENRTVPTREAWSCDDNGKQLPSKSQLKQGDDCPNNLVSLATTRYGMRPNFKGINIIQRFLNTE